MPRKNVVTRTRNATQTQKQARESDEYVPPPHVSDCWDDLVEIDDYNYALESNAANLVWKEFRGIREHYSKSILPVAQKRFSQDIRTIYPRTNHYRTYNGCTPISLVFGIPKKRQGVAKQSKYERYERSFLKISFSSCRMLPRMRYWAHTERNIETNDNLRLSHIPHIDDHLDDRGFVSELREIYTEGIHGADLGCGEYINDYMMYKLLTSVMSKWKKDKSYIHAAIFKAFPNKYSLRQLEDHMYITLKERFSAKKAAVTHSPTADETLNSTATMLCARCPEYDCTLHASTIFDTESKALEQIGTQIKKRVSCGKKCFLVKQNRILKIVIDSELMLQNIRSVLSADSFDVCQLTKIFNLMMSELNLKQFTCAEWNKHIEQIRRDLKGKIDSVDRKTVKKPNFRERCKLFRRFRSSIANNSRMHPCSHSGPCHKTPECPCFENNVACTKYCRCSVNCVIKFPGCSCTPGYCSTLQCPCFLGRWECDPDTCSSCNCDVINIKKGTDGKNMALCRNVFIQIGMKKNIHIGVSNIAGWGCFLIGTAEKGDLISEYTGEIISNDEAERRGRVCDKYACSYVFGLNDQQSIDAGRMGNLIRFANHSDKNPNCEAKIIIVNGDQRIGIYAKRHIKNEEELFFDYGYKGENKQYVSVQLTRNGTKNKQR